MRFFSILVITMMPLGISGSISVKQEHHSPATLLTDAEGLYQIVRGLEYMQIFDEEHKMLADLLAKSHQLSKALDSKIEKGIDRMSNLCIWTHGKLSQTSRKNPGTFSSLWYSPVKYFISGGVEFIQELQDAADQVERIATLLKHDIPIAAGMIKNHALRQRMTYDLNPNELFPHRKPLLDDTQKRVDYILASAGAMSLAYKNLQACLIDTRMHFSVTLDIVARAWDDNKPAEGLALDAVYKWDDWLQNCRQCVSGAISARMG